MMFDAREMRFLEQKELFIQKALHALNLKDLADVPDPKSRWPIALQPVLIEDYRNVSDQAKKSLADAYWGVHGIVHFLILNPTDSGERSHPLLQLAQQLAEVIPLKYPVDHPMEGHKEAVSRFGPADGTLKIYDLETKDGTTGYREQAETAEMFDAHNDGLGYGGAVEVFALYADSGPLSGGYTYFQNIVALALNLARTDPDAFTSLFLPDAITALRPRGKGAIKVTTPVLFLNEHGRPHVFFRLPTGEYRITWRKGLSALDRAAAFLSAYAQPFAPGSTFINLSRVGAGCFARNEWVVHGRTPFIDGRRLGERRVLARKWFMSAAQHTKYKHVPGMHVLDQFARVYPERFGPEFLVGDWNYDASTDSNVRIS